jgi:hypothetical protein
VAAAVELGTGNELFIRGQGGGLSWAKGQPLASQGHESWVWTAAAPQGKVEFQLLLNDQVWARGENLVIEAGQKVEVCPDFEWPDIPRTV